MGRHRKKDRHLPPRMQRKGRVYYHTPYIDGRVVWTRLADNYADALREWAQREVTVKEHGSTIGDALDRYLMEALPKLAEATQREYRRYGKRLREVFGSVHLEDVRASHIAGYLDRHPAKTMANREIAMLSSIYGHAMRWGWCDQNPCMGVRRNTERRRNKLPDQHEIDAILAAAPKQISLIVQLALLTGARKEDLLAIKLADLTTEGLMIEVHKTRRANDNRPQRRIQFEWSDDLRSVVEKARGLRRRVGSLYLFANRQGQRYTTSGFDSMWRRVLIKANIQGLHFHDLRARALTDAKNQGGMEYAVSLAAHESASTTERYIRDRDSARVRPLKPRF